MTAELKLMQTKILATKRLMSSIHLALKHIKSVAQKNS